MTNTAVSPAQCKRATAHDNIWISNGTTRETLYAFSCRCQLSLHLSRSETLFLQRTQVVWHRLAVEGILMPSVRRQEVGRDSPASCLCSCGVWSPVCRLLWLRCVCGNSCLDLWGVQKWKCMSTFRHCRGEFLNCKELFMPGVSRLKLHTSFPLKLVSTEARVTFSSSPTAWWVPQMERISPNGSLR